MRRIYLTVSALALAAAFTAAPAGAAQDPPPCDPGPCVKDVIVEKVQTLSDEEVDKIMWAVRCIGDSLGGNACTGP